MRAWALPSIFLVAGLSTIAIFTLAVAIPSSTSVAEQQHAARSEHPARLGERFLPVRGRQAPTFRPAHQAGSRSPTVSQ